MGFRSDSGRREFGSRSSSRPGGFNRGGFGGRREGGFGERRSSGGFGERRRPEMHDVTCDKCGKECQVPFRPTGDKPVLCSDCFRKDGGASRDSRGPRESSGSSSGISQEQFKQLNTKLDKIIEFLEQIEFEDESEEGEESDENEEAEESENSGSEEKAGEEMKKQEEIEETA